jgi:hypothetical protein
MTCERVCVLVNVDEGNNEGVCDDVLDMEKIVTPPLEMIDLIDLDMEDGEVPIQTTLSQWDTWLELMLVVPFIVQDSDTVFNSVDYIRMGQGYNQHCVENAAMGL